MLLCNSLIQHSRGPDNLMHVHDAVWSSRTSDPMDRNVSMPSVRVCRGAELLSVLSLFPLERKRSRGSLERGQGKEGKKDIHDAADGLGRRRRRRRS